MNVGNPCLVIIMYSVEITSRRKDVIELMMWEGGAYHCGKM